MHPDYDASNLKSEKQILHALQAICIKNNKSGYRRFDIHFVL